MPFERQPVTADFAGPLRYHCRIRSGTKNPKQPQMVTQKLFGPAMRQQTLASCKCHQISPRAHGSAIILRSVQNGALVFDVRPPRSTRRIDSSRKLNGQDLIPPLAPRTQSPFARFQFQAPGECKRSIFVQARMIGKVLRARGHVASRSVGKPQRSS